MKSIMGFGGVDRVTDRIVKEIDNAQAAGKTELWVEFSQDEIGLSNSATTMATFIRRKIEKAGHQVVDGSGGQFGDNVRMLIRFAPK